MMQDRESHSYYGRRIWNHTQLSTGAIFSDLQWQHKMSRSRYHLMSNNSKMVQDRASYNGGPIVSRIWSVERTAPYSATLNDPYLDFKVTPLFDTEYIRNGTTYSKILIGTYTRPAEHCHFEWPWMTRLNVQWHEASRGVLAMNYLFWKWCKKVDVF